MFGGTAVSPLLAPALLNLDGKHRLSGWQWIFLGMFLSILIGVSIVDYPQWKDFGR